MKKIKKTKKSSRPSKNIPLINSYILGEALALAMMHVVVKQVADNILKEHEKNKRKAKKQKRQTKARK